MLAPAEIQQVFVSSFKRTQLTAKPMLQQQPGLPAQIEEDSDTVALKIRAASGNVLVVGHSNTVPEIIASLGGPAGLPFLQGFDNLLILTLGAGGSNSLIQLKYGEPSP